MTGWVVAGALFVTLIWVVSRLVVATGMLTTLTRETRAELERSGSWLDDNHG